MAVIRADVVIGGTDATGPAFASAARGVEGLARHMKAAAGDRHGGFHQMGESLRGIGEHFRHIIGKSAEVVTALTGIATGVSFVGLALALRNSGEELDKLYAKSLLFGVSVQKLRELHFIARQQHADEDMIDKSVQRIAELTGAAQAQTKAGAQERAKLNALLPGLGNRLSQANNVEEGVNIVAGAISSGRTPQEREFFAKQLVGERNAREFGKLLNADEAQLKKYREQSREEEGTVSQEQALKARQMIQAQDSVTTALAGISTGLSVEFAKSFTGPMNEMAKAISSHREVIVKNFGALADSAADLLRRADWDAIGSGLVSFGRGIVNTMAAFNAVIAFVQSVDKALLGVNKSISAFSTSMNGVIDNIGTNLMGDINHVRTELTDNWKLLTDSLSGMATTLGKAWTNVAALFDQMNAKIGHIVGALGDLINRILNLLPHAPTEEDVKLQKERNWQPEIAPGIPRPFGAPPAPGAGIGAHALGGRVSAGGWSVVGERGPELVNWANSGTVVSNLNSASMFSRLTSVLSTLASALDRLTHSMGGGGGGGGSEGRAYGGGGGRGPGGGRARSVGGAGVYGGTSSHRSVGGAGVYSKELGPAIKEVAGHLGMSAEDLGTMISFETAGTFDPWKKGPHTKWGTHRGLIQWGEPQARQYGVTKDSTVAQQMGAVENYLTDHGFKKGMSGVNAYAAINAGNALKTGASDAAAGGTWGTVADKWNFQMAGHRRNARRLLAMDGMAREPSADMLHGGAAGAQKVELGKGQIDVRIKLDGHAGATAQIRQHEGGQFALNTGADLTGRRAFAPGASMHTQPARQPWLAPRHSAETPSATVPARKMAPT